MCGTDFRGKGVLWKDRKQWFGNRVKEQGGGPIPPLEVAGQQ